MGGALEADQLTTRSRSRADRSLLGAPVRAPQLRDVQHPDRLIALGLGDTTGGRDCPGQSSSTDS